MERKNIDIGLLILRLTIGVLMLLHGVSKLIHGIGFIEGMFAEMGLPAFFAYGVLVGEIVAPALLIIGYRTRLAAIVFAFNMLVAVAMVHINTLFTLSPQGGWAVELPAMFMLVAVVLIITGGGKYAVSNKNRWD